jgi:hypothetical protein
VARDIVTTGGTSRQPVEPIDKAQNVGDGEGLGPTIRILTAPAPCALDGLPTVRRQPVDRQPRRRVGMQSAQVQVDLLCLCDEGRYT